MIDFSHLESSDALFAFPETELCESTTKTTQEVQSEACGNGNLSQSPNVSSIVCKMEESDSQCEVKELFQQQHDTKDLRGTSTDFSYLFDSKLESNGICETIPDIEQVETLNKTPAPSSYEPRVADILAAKARIKARDKHFDAHRYFLESYSAERVGSLVDHVHGGNMPTTECGVISLLKASADWKVHSLVEECLQILWKKINPNNALIMRACVETVGNGRWREKIGEYIRRHLDDVCLSGEFLRLPFVALRELVCRRNDHCADGEVKLLESIFRWIKASDDVRRDYLPELLRYIRIPLLPVCYVSKILRCELIEESSDCVKIIVERRRRGLFRLFRPIRKPSRVQQAYLGSKELMPYVFYTVYRTKQPSVEIYNYNSLIRCWNFLTKWVYDNIPTYLVCSERRLYFIGSNCTDVVDLSDRKKSCLPIIGHTPAGAGIVFHEGEIYFFGNVSFCQAAEVLYIDPENGRCLHVGDMLEGRVDPGVVALQSNIYITGGYNATTVLTSSEKYDPKTRQCTPISPMLSRRYGHGCAALMGKIYICGGCTRGETQDLSTRTAEVYDPSCDQWTPIAKMYGAEFCRVSLFTLRNELVAVDADPDDNNYFQMSIYDPSAQEWRYGGYVLNCGIDMTIVTPYFASPLWRS